jgi:opacity protein-like surface antigen
MTAGFDTLENFMKSRIMKTVVAAAALSCFVGAQAQSNPGASPVYGELGWASITYKESGYKLQPGMVRAIVGTEVNPNLNVEGMLGFGISDDTVSIQNVRVTGEISNAWGIFLKPKATIAPNLELFGRVGYVKTKVTASVPGYAVSDTGGDLAYGAGLSYKISDTTSLNADYMSYYNKDGVKGTGFTIGLGLRF